MTPPKTKQSASEKSVGRPSKFTKSVIAKIVKAIKAGATYEHAALAAGIGVSTLYDWKARGEAGEERYVEFLEALKTAEGAGAVELLTRIKIASEDPKFWVAAAWILERRHPEIYGRQKIDVNHSGSVSLSWADMVQQARGSDDNDNP